MIVIGVTGGIGSGKSLVCSEFSALGIPIFFADEVAKDVLHTDRSVAGRVSKEFGVDVAGGDPAAARRQLAAIVFADAAALERLNSIIHPAVFERFDRWKRETSLSAAPYAMAEAALLFESGFDERMDYVLLVTSDEQTRIRRVVERDGSNVSDVTARIRRQMSPQEAVELSDFTIANDGTPEQVRSSVRFFHTLFSHLTTRNDDL